MVRVKYSIIPLIILFIFITSINLCFITDTTTATGQETHNVYEGQSIQNAIENANASDIIYIHSGTYNENIEISKTLTIMGENKVDTIISCQTSNHAIKITADSVNISDLTIQNTTGSGYDCIMLDKANNCTIEDNILQNSNDAGISLFDSDSNTIQDNTIKTNQEYGISLSYSENNIINNNEIYYNENGIDIGSYSYNNEVYDNTLLGRQGELLGIGIDVRTNTNGNIIYKNSISNFDYNAKDQGTSNTWYRSSSQEGNYWDDYTGQKTEQGYGNIPYDIEGNANSKDIYPLGYFLNPIIPTAEILIISPNPAYVGETIHFEGYSTDDGAVVQREWKINNNVVSNAEDFSYSGLSQGIYTVYFRVKDNEGVWSNTDQETLVVNSQIIHTPNQKPNAYIQKISPAYATFGTAISFSGYGTDSDGIITKYNWSSSLDGYLPETSTFTISSLSVGTHKITFRVRDNEGSWSNETEKSVTIVEAPNNEPPVAKTNGPYTGYANETITFNASGSYDTDGTIAIYKWDFGDGNTKNGRTVTHSYKEENDYNVTLTITDNLGGQAISKTNANITIKTNDTNNKNQTNDNETPGFEMITFLITIILIAIIKKKRK